jgi:hypothetical protein
MELFSLTVSCYGREIEKNAAVVAYTGAATSK